MTASRYGHFIRHAAMVSRRRLLQALGGAGLTAVAAPALVEAGKSGKSGKKQARNLCRQDAAQCRAVVPELCTGSSDPACETKLVVCCEHLARCRLSDAVLCIRDND